MKWMTVILSKFLLVSIGLILLSAFTGLFRDQPQLEWGLYIESVSHILQSFIRPDLLTVTSLSGHEHQIFESFWPLYQYSLLIFLPALFLSIGLSVLLSYLTILLPDKIRFRITQVAALLESTPDLLIILVIQATILAVLKESGILLFSVAATAQNPSYVLPIVALSLIPALMFYKVTLFLVNDELKKPYVELARGQGFSTTSIFFSHIFRNITPSFFTHSKAILLILLSSMFVFERLFNISGLFTYLIRYPEPNVIAFALILFYVPIFLLYMLFSVLIARTTGQRLEW
ncbi:ABC transporter permease subunit [Planomicrobium okeanokoites]|uniref:ABC transporter permease subunit n=1 Tax=Planomicrobium okeanokoites TaxID=244 RepID=A0ABV7KQ41_PLAOK|nr:ABC transporter permease subunit [Planomicrobium okeanokoites]TAA71109.1 peptide transporter [Planomicrobium okeanokoites]